MERNLTTGSIPKTIFSFSLPYFLSYFLQTLYGTADLFIIGQFNSVDSTTAVSIGSQVMHMLTVMIVGLAMGTTVMTGRAVGAQDRRQVNLAVGNTAFFHLIRTHHPHGLRWSFLRLHHSRHSAPSAQRSQSRHL